MDAAVDAGHLGEPRLLLDGVVLAAADLADPALAREGLAACDEITSILGLGSVDDFQRA